MANGKDSDEIFICSQVRTGLKREYAFASQAYGSQAQMYGSLGRTRARKAQNQPMGSPTGKRLKVSSPVETKREAERDSEQSNGEVGEEEKAKAVEEDFGDSTSEEEAKSGVVDAASDDEPKYYPCDGEVVGERVFEEELKSSVEAKGDNMVESVIQEELKDDMVEPVNGEKSKEERTMKSDSEKPSVEEAHSVPLIGEDIKVEVEGVVVENPSRRLTRSALKQKPETVKKSIVKEKNSDVLRPLVTTPVKVDRKTPSSSKKFPSNLKDLLETGLLEGQPVTYIRGKKVKESGDSGLRGVIRGCGVECHCVACKGSKVVKLTEFEIHAGSLNKNPGLHIYLENGNTLRDFMIGCRNSTLVARKEAVRSSVGGSSRRKSTVCPKCKEGSVREAGTGKDAMLLCNSCIELKESHAKPVETANNAEELPKSVTVSKLSNGLLKGSSSESKSHGRVTRKDLRMHKSVFEEDVLPDGTEVAYYDHGKKLLVGYKKGNGIICSCCSSEVSPSLFEAHADRASRRKPYLHIYTSNGVSLHELSLSLSRTRKFPTKKNDDLCTVCHVGGDLLCCDTCPRAFHPVCLKLPTVPTGSWYCKNCQNLFEKEKFVERNANAVAAGRVPGIDSIEQITNRRIHIINTEEIDFGGCALCSGHDFNKSGFGPETVLYCDQCEREFHVGCLKDHQIQDLKEVPKGMWFCTSDCHRINSALQKLVIYGEQELPDSLLSSIRKKHTKDGAEDKGSVVVKWRVLDGKLSSDDDIVLLRSKILSIFNDSFAPIVDSDTQSDIITSMLNGSNVKGQSHDFSRMYCAILTVNGSVVSAGMFRIYGSEVAELPLVATSAQCQGQGYFQTLFACIERFLAFLNVKNLVLPAADEAESIWTKKFGFAKLAQDQINNRKEAVEFLGSLKLEKEDVYTVSDG
ncbi:hypothetical protein FNV43_RR05601 [Rhamnella rubrinervis]|uniref:PHD-type domain-containing protein n=1 Tax=Rhamnella rubrinervis TaxID=2594499 RepID=A0A8K0MRD7_9ROSA|nr:hypothetical protein FNV43_RR05601 [Rhamnella rubrinervis]